MAIPKFLEDLNIISKLGDYPGSDNNLSTAQFKAKFDEAGQKIQNYINNTLLPQLNQLVDVQALLDGILDKTLSLSDKAANAKSVGDALGLKLNKMGDTMSGILCMGGRKITDLATPTSAMDASNKDYVDTTVASTHATKTVTLPASGWSAAAPYKQTVAAEWIKVTDNPHWDVVLSAATDTAIAELEAFAVVDDLDTADGSITFTCLEEKPAVGLTILMEVNR